MTLREFTQQLLSEEQNIAQGGGAKAIDRQHKKGRLTARERIAKLCDPRSPSPTHPVSPSFFELGLWAAYQMYADWGGAPSAGVITGVGTVANRHIMIIANDATVKAGAFFPMTVKKVLRAQRIALDNRLPLVYLVDSAGVFLPLQDEIFPDEDDFGRIFRNNAVISASGIPQFAAIMGNCVAGGGYLPVLSDKLLMTEGSGLYLAGPALVKAAIGQQVGHEELGGAKMHASISGTIDYREPNDEACLARLRRLIELLPPLECGSLAPALSTASEQNTNATANDVDKAAASRRSPKDLYDLIDLEGRKEYDVRDVIHTIIDGGQFEEYKAEFGLTMVCGYARIGGIPVGIVSNQKHRCKPARGQLQFGGVIYVDSADKSARFIMDCNQTRVPIIFLQDVNGFMVGRDSEQEGIIKAGAKLVNAIANSVVPKITVILGGSYGAGNYALCGKAFDPRFIFAWPSCKYAVMGGQQAAGTMLDITVSALRRQGHEPDAKELEELRKKVQASYDEQTDVRYAAARLWVDKIIDPAETREALMLALQVATRHDEGREFKTGVLQV